MNYVIQLGKMMKKRVVFRKSVILVGLFILCQSLLTSAYALDGLALVDAGFTVVNPTEKKEDPEEFVEIVELQQLKDSPIFFWSRVVCHTETCTDRLRSGEVKLIHRWVRVYGISKLRTQQLKTFEPKELVDSTALSEQKIEYPGRWFVEISTSDGVVLCIEKEKDCKFSLGVK